ncbi:MAG TPA: zf-HC2 domain-containing protein [Candidatus Saccharimonadales bacterium]|nr:zf-HC2 domain-containing protein [Candidatus Saccharimonadales bacterium]
MNCETFNDLLPEYLDETLPAGEQAAVREHVLKCGTCQRTLAREEASAKSIRFSFNRETEGLSLRPEIRQNILIAANQPEAAPSIRENIRACWASLWRQPAWAGAVLFCLLLLVFGALFYLHPAKRSSAQASTYVIDVPLQTETYIYRRHNNTVVDAVVTGVSVIDAKLID